MLAIRFRILTLLVFACGLKLLSQAVKIFSAGIVSLLTIGWLCFALITKRFDGEV